MKNPLHYQVTEFDCGPTTMMNAVSFLFERDEIPPEVLKYIMLYCLDSYNGKGEAGKSGTSTMAMMFLSAWLGQYSKAKKFPVQSQYLSGEEVWIGGNSPLIGALQQGGAVVIRVIYGCWHYVLLTRTKDNQLWLFDPYYRKRPFSQEGIRLLTGSPTENRRVDFAILNREEKTPYALGPVEGREAVILYNAKTRRTPEKTIEYFI